MQINEPTTVVTDIILGGQTLLYAILLQRGNTTGQRSVRSWSAMMAAVSVAAFAGAVSHALYYDSAVNWVGWLRNAAWKLVGLSTAVGSGLMLVAVIFNTIPTGRRALFIIAAGAKSVIFAVVAWFSGNYLYTIIDYGLSMLIVLAVQIRSGAVLQLRHGWQRESSFHSSPRGCSVVESPCTRTSTTTIFTILCRSPHFTYCTKVPGARMTSPSREVRFPVRLREMA